MISNQENAVVRRVLVTGASGFVGRHFCAYACAHGWAVRRVQRAAALTPGDAMEVVQADLQTFDGWPAVLAGVDVVVHLAARVHQMREDPQAAEAAHRAMNVEVTRRLVEQSIAAGVKRFVFVSTIKVNGETTTGHPFVETDPPAPFDWYARSKLEAEELLRTLAESAGMEWVVVRPPLVFGPGVGGNFRSLVRLANKGLPLPMGGLVAQRSYVNVWNLAELLELCCHHPAAAGQVFLAADCTLPTCELVKALGQPLGKTPLLVPVPASFLKLVARLVGRRSAADRLTSALEVDASKAKRLLGWRAETQFAEAVRATVASLMENS